MHHPAIAGAHLEIDAGEDVRFVDVHVGIAQRHQHAALARPRVARARSGASGTRCCSCCSSSRACAARIAPLRFTAPCSSSSRCVIESGTSSRRCVANTQGIDERAVPLQPVQETRVVARIEPVGDFVEQQQLRPAGERARDEHQAPFAIRKREEAALGERADAEAPRTARRRGCLRRRQRAHRNVGALHAGARRLRARGNSIRSVRSGPGARRRRRRSLRSTPAGVSKVSPRQSIAAQLAARGFRPHAARDQLEQLRLAGAVAADQQPALPGLDAPVHVAQHRALAAIEIDAPERDGKMELCCARAGRHAGAGAYRRTTGGARRFRNVAMRLIAWAGARRARRPAGRPARTAFRSPPRARCRTAARCRPARSRSSGRRRSGSSVRSTRCRSKAMRAGPVARVA